MEDSAELMVYMMFGGTRERRNSDELYELD
jgi:hypothetical protein